MSTNVERIFHEVANLSSADRKEFFAQNNVPEEVQREVNSLLAFDQGSTQFLAQEILTSFDGSLSGTASTRRCGPYRLERLLGQGGMGAVYLAERVDGEVRQQVAVKLLRYGLDDPVRLERFLQERQILATLNHPNIARLLDAGRCADGQPYLVMDYVAGQPIDEYAKDLPMRRKIELLLKICPAISYAHRNLIVHRDLKPNNILVDATGCPKLLDFGIARILDKTGNPTLTIQRMLTPEYASPEHVAGRPVTTAADVYSIGGVLYKLLTGKGPHDFGQTTLEEMLQAITTREVIRPSALISGLQGDLNAILIKALRKEPNERYRSVDEFAGDLQAFLESRPISARRGEWSYRARKFVKRRWAPLAGVSVALLSLTVGLVIAAQERNMAQRRFAQVRQLANQLFDIDRRIEPLAGAVQARQTIVNTALGYIEGLQREAAGDPQLLGELATALEHVAEVQGGAGKPNLGQPNQALRNLRRAEGLRHQISAARPQDREMLRSLLSNIEAQARTNYTAWEESTSQSAIQRGLPLLDRLLSGTRVSAEDYAAAAAFSRTAAGVYLNSGPFREALPFSLRTLEYTRKAEQLKPSHESKGKLAEAMFSRADILRADGQLAESLRMLEETDRYLAGVQNAYPDNASLQLLTIKTAYTEGLAIGDQEGPSQRRFQDAIAPLERAFAMSEARVKKNPGELYSHYLFSIVAWKLGRALEESDPERALQVYRRGIESFDGFPSDHPQRRSVLRSLAGSIHCLIALGRSSETRPLVEGGFALMKVLKRYPAQKLGPSAGDTEFFQAYAEAEFATGDRVRGHATVHEILDKIDKFDWQVWDDLQDAGSFSWHLQQLTKIEQRAGNIRCARSLEERRLAYWQHWNCKKPGSEAVLAQLAAIPHTEAAPVCPQ